MWIFKVPYVLNDQSTHYLEVEAQNKKEARRLAEESLSETKELSYIASERYITEAGLSKKRKR